MAAEFVVLVGLQASGKSSFCAERFSRTHVVVSKDDFPARKREARQRRALEAAFATQKDVVLERPSLEEGFDRLYYVCLREGTFDVAPWHEDP